MTERKITITKHKFGEDTSLAQMQEWQALGVSAIWEASFELLDLWFTMHGLDPKAQRIDRSKIEKVKAPWLVKAQEGN